MAVDVEEIRARIREIEERLRNLELGEMTEGWLSCEPTTAEVARLYQEREQLLQELAKVA